MSGASTSAARGPWTATSDVSSVASWSSAARPANRSRSSSATIVALPAFGTTRNALVTGPVDDEVVDDAPVRRADERVLGTTDVEPSRVVRQSGRERRSRVRALDAELAHVREVEESDGRPHRDVLVDDAAVPDRHLPAPERREAGARGDVALVQGGPGRRLGHVIGALPSRASSPAGPAGVEMPATGRARARMSRSVG